MGHIVRDANWASIDLNTDTGLIFVQQKWKYNWLVDHGLSVWTYTEKKAFHDQADRLIWRQWSGKAFLKATGNSILAKRLVDKNLTVNFDISWVKTGGHWTANVTKIKPKGFKRSNIIWSRRELNLDSEDVKLHEEPITKTCSGSEASYRKNQYPLAHEFGHAIGNVRSLNRGDEYNCGHTHIADTTAMMHTGSQLRKRYFQTLIEELDQMELDTKFEVVKLL